MGAPQDDFGFSIFGMIFPLIFFAIFVSIIIFAVRASMRHRQNWTQPWKAINPQTRAEDNGVVVNVRYMGSAQATAFDPSQRPLFLVGVNVQGQYREARVVLPDEWSLGFGMARNSWNRMQGGQQPYILNETVRVEFDTMQPGRCNILTPIVQMRQFAGQPQNFAQAPVAPAPQQQAPRFKFCRHCSSQNEISAKRCTGCGSRKFE